MDKKESDAKYHKSCDYCRYRKVKCHLTAGNESCEHCKLCEVPCIFSIKERSNKRKIRSAKIAAEVQVKKQSVQDNSRDQTPIPTANSEGIDSSDRWFLNTYQSLTEPLAIALESAVIPEYDKHQGDFFLPGMDFDIDKKFKEFYNILIRPYTPVIPENLLTPDSRKLSPFLKFSIVAYLTNTTNLFETIYDWISIDGSYPADAIFPLALLGVKYMVPKDLISSIFYLGPVNYQQYDPIGILSILSLDAWGSFLSSTEPKLLEITDSIYSSVNSSTVFPENLFSNHFAILTTILHRFIVLKHEIDSYYTPNSPRMPNWKRRGLQIESDLLLWPVKLPRELSVVKDELISTDGALVLHILSNTVLCSIYHYALTNQSSVGKLFYLLPVPGVLQFLSGMAKSNFINGEIVQEKWPNIRQHLVITARIMLDTIQTFGYDYSKVALSFWTDQESDPDLYLQVQKALNYTDWSDDADGAAVYWVYRDCRSMSLNLHLSEVENT